MGLLTPLKPGLSLRWGTTATKQPHPVPGGVLLFLYSCSHLVCCSRTAQGGSLTKPAHVTNSAQHDLPFGPGKPGSPAAPARDKRKTLITDDPMRVNYCGSPRRLLQPLHMSQMYKRGCQVLQSHGALLSVPAGAATPACCSLDQQHLSGRARRRRASCCSICWSVWGIHSSVSVTFCGGFLFSVRHL